MHAEHAGSLLGSSLQQHARAWAYAELHTTPHQPSRTSPAVVMSCATSKGIDGITAHLCRRSCLRGGHWRC